MPAKKSVYEDRSKAVQTFLDKRRADLETQIDRLVTLIEFVQTAISKEITSGEGSKGNFVSPDSLKKLQSIVTTAEVASRTKISIAKAEKLLGSRLTREQILDNSRKTIMALTYAERAKVIREMAEAHLAENAALWHHTLPNTNEAAIKSVLKVITDAAVADKTS